MHTARRVKVGRHLLKVLEQDPAYEYPEELGNAPADVVRVFNKLTDLLSELQEIEDKHPFGAVNQHLELAQHSLNESIRHLRMYGHGLSPMKRRVRKTSPKVAKEGYPIQWHLDGHLRGQKSPISPYRSPKKKPQRKSPSSATKRLVAKKPSMTTTSTMHVHGVPVQTKRRVPARKLVKP